MRLIAATLIAATALATPLIAQQMPGSKDKAAITGGAYTVDANHTLVKWEVNHFGFSPLWGLFGQVTGTMQLDPKNPAASKVDVTIPVSKMVTGVPGFTAHLLRDGKDGGKPDFFGSAPADARFVSTSVMVDASGEAAKVSGNLTLNGVTKPVTLDVDFYGAGKAPAQMGGKENVGFEAEATIKRSDFGLGYAVPLVSDEVELTIAAAFQK
ncbi:polyisoprenoid-binding protein YceI [Sphingomonas sp. BE123]|jgi:polyisoprenoid-binding protein YceI|uniref:YceI family protein n=1 Tax=Sphingomonas sp. BE123 TaxID=2817842 RepID=UPI00285E06D9|nr:YceI family protein [Sphingomonas sp. BE123]MDR6850644.1 polyisoprenoid-binding protein YceI [Sphingomonas sp. BE123]